VRFKICQLNDLKLYAEFGLWLFEWFSVDWSRISCFANFSPLNSQVRLRITEKELWTLYYRDFFHKLNLNGSFKGLNSPDFKGVGFYRLKNIKPNLFLFPLFTIQRSLNYLWVWKEMSLKRVWSKKSFLKGLEFDEKGIELCLIQVKFPSFLLIKTSLSWKYSFARLVLDLSKLWAWESLKIKPFYDFSNWTLWSDFSQSIKKFNFIRFNVSLVLKEIAISIPLRFNQ